MQPPEPDVSVVVATHNRPERLGRLLTALRRQTVALDRFEVVVVDDASSPHTARVLEVYRVSTPSLALKVIRLEEPGGAGTARECGRLEANGTVIAFTDDDCEPTPGWLEAVLDAMAGSDSVFVQGPTLPNPAETSQIGPLSRTINLPGPTATFNTCNIAYPRKLLERIGGFDLEAFGGPGAWGEDTDLAWRAIDAGGTPRFAPEATVHHAVEYFGVIRMLREATRWTPAVKCFARHPQLRRAQLHRRVFWKPTHEWVCQAALGLVPGIPLLLRVLLAIPYLRSVRARIKLDGGGARLAPFYVAHDVIETVSIGRGAIRYRTPMI